MTEHIQQKNSCSSAVQVFTKELKRVDSGIRFRRTLFHTLFTLIVVAAVAVLIATFMFPVLHIYGSSMTPTLQEGEVVFSVKTSEIGRGELVAFYYGNKVLIKRCIGIAGDVIDLDEDGNVFVNEALLEEPYLSEKAFGECDIELPFQVPDGRYFVLGDQRDTSIDSRNTLIGCIAAEQIIGSVAFRIWPFNEFGTVQ